VRRHLDLVFATALRKVTDTGAAQEVAQNVFVALARKAWQFAPDDSLPAWLHKAALLEWKSSPPGRSPKRKSGWPDSQSLVVGWHPIVEFQPSCNDLTLTGVTLKTVRLTKSKSVTALSILALLIAVGVVLYGTSRGLSRVVTSASVQRIKLEAWHFKSARVLYDLPNRPWARRLEKWLPNRVRQRLGLSQPIISAVVTPDFQGEPLLSAAFSISGPTGTPEVGVLRLVVSDDRGQEFDPAFMKRMCTADTGSRRCAPSRGAVRNCVCG